MIRRKPKYLDNWLIFALKKRIMIEQLQPKKKIALMVIQIFIVLSTAAYFLMQDTYQVETTRGGYPVYGQHIGFPLPMINFWPSGEIRFDFVQFVVCGILDLMFAFVMTMVLIRLESLYHSVCKNMG
jgi:hypothetical protein